MQVTRVKAALQATSARAAGDSQALLAEHGGPLDPELLGSNGDGGQPRVKLFRSEIASCKGGQFLVRTTTSNTSKVDYLAYVPYVLDAAGQEEEGNMDDWPGAINTVMKIKDIFTWHQTPAEGGDVEVTRFALGDMHELQPVGDPQHGYQIQYTDSSGGGRAAKPSLLQRLPGAQGGGAYTYGVRLDQIECTLVSTRDEQFFIPTLKMSTFG